MKTEEFILTKRKRKIKFSGNIKNSVKDSIVYENLNIRPRLCQCNGFPQYAITLTLLG